MHVRPDAEPVAATAVTAAVTARDTREPLGRVHDAAESPAERGEATAAGPATGPAGAPPEPGPADVQEDGPRPTCTQAQLRRFIKSRPWIPMHELRRRFGISGGDDDVTPVRTPGGPIFVGLPAPEARMLGELLNSGDVGYELSLDPGAPIVVGVYPMRPVPRG